MMENEPKADQAPTLPPVEVLNDLATNIDLESSSMTSVKDPSSCSAKVPSLVEPKHEKSLSLNFKPVPTLSFKGLVPCTVSVHETGSILSVSSIEQKQAVALCPPSDVNHLSHQDPKKGSTLFTEADTDVSSSVQPEKAIEVINDPLTEKLEPEKKPDVFLGVSPSEEPKEAIEAVTDPLFVKSVGAEPEKEPDLVPEDVALSVEPGKANETVKDLLTVKSVGAEPEKTIEAVKGPLTVQPAAAGPKKEPDLVHDMEPLKDTRAQVSTEDEVSPCEEAAIVFMQLEKDTLEAEQGAVAIEHQLKQNPKPDPVLPVCQLNHAVTASSTTSMGSLKSPQLNPMSGECEVNRADITMELEENPQLDSEFNVHPPDEATKSITIVKLEQDRAVCTGSPNEKDLKQKVFNPSQGQSNFGLELVEMAGEVSEQGQQQEATAAQPTVELQLVEYRPWVADLVSSGRYCVESKESLPQEDSDGELELSDFPTVNCSTGERARAEDVSKKEREEDPESRVLSDGGSLPLVQMEEELGRGDSICAGAKVKDFPKVEVDGENSAERDAISTAPSRDLSDNEPHPPFPAATVLPKVGEIIDDNAVTPPPEKRQRLSSEPVITPKYQTSITQENTNIQLFMSDKAIQFPSDEELADDGSDTLFQALPSECAREHPFIPNVPPCWAQDNQAGPNDRDDPPDEGPSGPRHSLQQHQWHPNLELLAKETPQSGSTSDPFQTLLGVDIRQSLMDENQLVPDENWQDSTTSQSFYLDAPEKMKPAVELGSLEQHLGLPSHSAPSSKTTLCPGDGSGALVQPSSAYSSCFPQPPPPSKPQKARNTGLGLASLARPRLRLGLSKRQKCRSLHDI